MKSLRMIGIITAIIFAIALFGSPVQAEISLGGDLEIDTSYTTTSTDPNTDTTVYDSSGRIKVVPSARTEAGDLYIEAVAQILVKTTNTFGVDDAYGKIGTAAFDFQIGRYEGWNLYDESNDMLIVEAPTGAPRYKANYSRGRMDGAGQMAVHAFASDAFSLEGGFIYGQDGTDNQYGVRPVVDIKAGNFEFLAGVDYLCITPQDDDAVTETTKLGYGARVKAVLGIATLGINYANGTVEETVDVGGVGVDLPDETTSSVGGYCDLALGEGVLTMGGSFTTMEIDGSSYDQEHTQYYVAYAHPLPIEGTTIKFAVSQASASNDDPAIEDSDALAFKVRLNYNF